MNNIIEIKNFSKSFGTKKVIEDLSFSVSNGAVFAFIGANGSGKTTTIRTLLNIYEPDSGELLINGKRYDSRDSSILGYLPEERGLYLNSKVLETMIYFAELKGMDRNSAKRKAIEYLEKVELIDKKNEKISKLSSGQQQKIQLGISIINSPELLILDEPTKGLDPVNRSLFLNMFLDLNKNGSTIMFSTHQMEEIEKIATGLLMIKNGKKELYGDIEKVKRNFGTNTIILEYSGELKLDMKMFRSTNIQQNFAELTPINEKSPQEILRKLIDDKNEVLGFKISTPSLNQIFIDIMKNE